MTFEEYAATMTWSTVAERTKAKAVWQYQQASIDGLLEDRANEATCKTNLQIEQLEAEVENYVTIISRLEGALARYSMDAGRCDQYKCEALAMRKALGFSADSENVAPIDLLNKLDGLLEDQAVDRARINELEQWIAAIADDHPQIPDWIQQSAKSLLAQEQE